MRIPSHLMVGALTGFAAHERTVLGLFAIAEMLCKSFGSVCTILICFSGCMILPPSIFQMPLLAVHEKSPLIGFTAYVYQSLLTMTPLWVCLTSSSLVILPAVMERLCGKAIGIGSAALPSGEPCLVAFPDVTVFSLNALYRSEYVDSITPSLTYCLLAVGMPSSSKDLLPSPFATCGSSDN